MIFFHDFLVLAFGGACLQAGLCFSAPSYRFHDRRMGYVLMNNILSPFYSLDTPYAPLSCLSRIFITLKITLWCIQKICIQAFPERKGNILRFHSARLIHILSMFSRKSAGAWSAFSLLSESFNISVLPCWLSCFVQAKDVLS